MKNEIRFESIESELTRNAINASIYKRNYRDAWKDIICSHGPYICLLTLQFQRSYPDSVTIPAANQFFYNLNRQIFGRRWFRKGWGFTGIVIAEQNKSHAATAGDLHFHCLLNQNKYLANINRDYNLYPLRDEAWLSARKLKDNQNRCMCSEKCGVDIRIIHDVSGITNYLTKEIDDYVSERGDQIYFLNYQGMTAGCLDQWRKRTC